MVIYRRWFLRIAELYFDEEYPDTGGDIARYLHRALPQKGFHCVPLSTILIDLSKPEADLFADIKKEVRYEIRRADRERLRYQVWHPCPTDILAQFADFYDRFVATTGLPAANRTRLRALAAGSLLCVSRVSRGDGQPLVWHAYIRTPARARLMHSASLFRQHGEAAQRQMVGWANRWHHWQDILEFKTHGLSLLDMGGWYGGTEDAARLRINDFKRGFGGTVVGIYNCLNGVTFKGKIALRALRMLGRL